MYKCNFCKKKIVAEFIRFVNKQIFIKINNKVIEYYAKHMCHLFHLNLSKYLLRYDLADIRESVRQILEESYCNQSINRTFGHL